MCFRLLLTLDSAPQVCEEAVSPKDGLWTPCGSGVELVALELDPHIISPVLVGSPEWDVSPKDFDQ